MGRTAGFLFGVCVPGLRKQAVGAWGENVVLNKKLPPWSKSHPVLMGWEGKVSFVSFPREKQKLWS